MAAFLRVCAEHGASLWFCWRCTRFIKPIELLQRCPVHFDTRGKRSCIRALWALKCTRSSTVPHPVHTFSGHSHRTLPLPQYEHPRETSLTDSFANSFLNSAKCAHAVLSSAMC